MGWQIALLVVLMAIIVVFMLWLTDQLAKRLGFNRADRITIQFCGSKKSLAAGLPMAIIILVRAAGSDDAADHDFPSGSVDDLYLVCGPLCAPGCGGCRLREGSSVGLEPHLLGLLAGC